MELREYLRDRPGARAIRGRYLRLRGGPETFVDRSWYYTVELSPGVMTKGLYESDFPMLPRMMMRRVNLTGADCLDLGSMEALIPVLMRRGGAKRVLATDLEPHCSEKIQAVKAAYDVEFDYQNVGPMDGLHRKIKGGFDLINCSGLLYHVWSPLHVLAGTRALLRRNGLMIVSTNVVLTEGMHAEFNAGGRMQDEPNTFWYPTLELLEYELRYLRLQPVDAIAVPHASIATHIRYGFDTPSAYVSVLCQATDRADFDPWMQRSVVASSENRSFSDWTRADRQAVSHITADNMKPIRLTLEEVAGRQVPGSVREQDAHVLHLADQS